jgi:hypothetical protein
METKMPNKASAKLTSSTAISAKDMERWLPRFVAVRKYRNACYRNALNMIEQGMTLNNIEQVPMQATLHAAAVEQQLLNWLFTVADTLDSEPGIIYQEILKKLHQKGLD